MPLTLTQETMLNELAHHLYRFFSQGLSSFFSASDVPFHS